MKERSFIADAREATGLHDGSITRIVRVVKPQPTYWQAGKRWLGPHPRNRSQQRRADHGPGINLSSHDVVIVGPFTRELTDPGWPSRLSQALGRPVEVHYVTCPPEIRKRRLEGRGDARDLAKLIDWESFLQYYGDSAPPVFDHVAVDGSGSPGE